MVLFTLARWQQLEAAPAGAQQQQDGGGEEERQRHDGEAGKGMATRVKPRRRFRKRTDYLARNSARMPRPSASAIPMMA